jgi:hypothetical protein
VRVRQSEKKTILFETTVAYSALGNYNRGGEVPHLHAEVEVYNPVSNTWRQLPNMPLPRHGSWASVIGNKIYIPGGGASQGLAATNTNQIFTVGEGPSTDFNGDGHPDYVLQNINTRQTAIYYLNNNVYVSSAYGPTLSVGWGLRGAADFNRDSHPDYALFNPVTDGTGILYLSGSTYIGSAFGPTLPSGWELVATADFNGDDKPDYVLYNAGSRQTAIWYVNNNIYVSSAYGPTLPLGWSLVAP